MFEAFDNLLNEYRKSRQVPIHLPGQTLDGHVSVEQPALASEIQECERHLGITLPPSYAAFLQRWNGAMLYHDLKQNFGVRLHGTRSIVHLNERVVKSWPAKHQAPILVFGEIPGTGGDHLGFDLTRPGNEYAVLDCHQDGAPRDWLQTRPIAATFADWLTRFIEHEGRLFWMEPD